MTNPSPLDIKIRKAEVVLENMERLLETTRSRPLENLTRAFIESRMKMLCDHYEKASTLHAEILATVPLDQRNTVDYFNAGVYPAITEVFEKIDIYLTTQLDNTIASSTRANVSTAEHNQSVGQSVSFNPHPNIKLPTISLPRFSGDIQQWPEFINLFDSSVHSHSSLQPLQKLQYLLSCLTGEAKTLFSSLALTDDNYEVARALLKSRYENKRVLLSTLLKRLTSLDKIHAENLTELKAFRSNYSVVLESLKTMKIPIDNWDPMLIHMLIQQFDKPLRRDWEEKLSGKTEFPKLTELDTFLDDRIHMCEVMSADSTRTVNANDKSKSRTTVHHGQTVDTVDQPRDNCPLCKQDHRLTRCQKFLDWDAKKRHELVKSRRLCFNCLSTRHQIGSCTSAYTCRTCKRKHHSLLHLGTTDKPSTEVRVNNTSVNQSNERLTTHLGIAKDKQILLATACVAIISPAGQRLICRALIDQCSEASFISESLVQTAGLRRSHSSFMVSGVGDPDGVKTRGQVKAKVGSRDECNSTLDIEALILPRITFYAPPQVDLTSCQALKGLTLADSQLTESTRIDLLLGADYYPSLIRDGLVHIDNDLVAQNTIFGWIVSGRIEEPTTKDRITIYHSTIDDLNSSLRSFWELEEVAKPERYTGDEQRCEQFFAETTTRDSSGRFIVRLPFKSGHHRNELGPSKHIALAALNRLRKRIDGNERLRDEYIDFLKEYESLGHMTRIPESADLNRRVFLPHHGVLREDKLTTKLRVVFNASCTTASGKSLNDVLAIGPKLQTDITGVLLRWRTHRLVFSADIEKMFRQILVHPRDRPLQNILWCDPSTDKLICYQLDTVTYGTGPAPYLAMRVVRELANQVRESSPLAHHVLISDIYVDDVMFGADDRATLIETKRQVVDTLQSGCLVLRKWASNDPGLLEPSECSPALLEDSNSLVKLLGINWMPANDTLVIQSISLNHQAKSKREILSEIASLFDPLGLLSPIIIRAKCYMQNLWIDKLGWDEPLSTTLRDQWSEIAQDMNSLPRLEIARWINYSPNLTNLELVGFCDASRAAYAATVYARVTTNDTTFVHLLMAKTRVAPLKTISIPRLELCGAVLLKDLLVHVKSLIGTTIDDVRCFSDSNIVLAWLNKTPSTWTTFVCNRVSAIQTEIPEATWMHVRSKENPADLNSRGLTTIELRDSSLWWNGPEWLVEPGHPESAMPVPCTNEESRPVKVHATQANDHVVHTLFRRYSTWDKIVRIMSYIVRFISRCRKRDTGGQFSTLSHFEVQEARRILFTTVQAEHFRPECKLLAQGLPVEPKSGIASLNPFLDEYGLLRVGGRLEFSKLNYHAKHPLILANDDLATKLVRHAHFRAKHGGLTLTLGLLREEYWVIRARSRVKYVIRTCVRCTRSAPKLGSQLMANLPAERCTPARAFNTTGLDYAGPIRYRLGKGRGRTTQKAWVAVFVCFSTRAIHLDLVTDYSAKAFLAALDRFVARRGLPMAIHSDNGTTFQGADRELRDAVKSIVRDPQVTSYYCTQGLEWKFIPPGAPHFGGLWEAGVKSVKFHLTRLMEDFAPTYEEMYTVLCGIEACLNSRPLGPLHDDCESLEALTPGHFLVGSSLLAPPRQVLAPETNCLTDRWKQVAHRVAIFWQKWQQDYLHTLQTRNKWVRPEANVAVGDLVILQTPNAAPVAWPLARILEVYPGKDGKIRVVKVRTSKSEYVRPIAKICVLHLPEDN